MIMSTHVYSTVAVIFRKGSYFMDIHCKFLKYYLQQKSSPEKSLPARFFIWVKAASKLLDDQV